MKTIRCSQCGRENPANLLHCGHCQQNLPFFPPKKESETAPRETTPEETKLTNQIFRMELLMFLFVLIPIGVALYVTWSFFSYESVPEGVYGQMMLLFRFYIWGPLLLFPVIGFFIAWARKQTLAERLSEMVKKNK